LTNGINKIEQALTVSTLSSHFATIQAKRSAQSFIDPNSGKLRIADSGKAKDVLNDVSSKAQYVFSRAETNKLKELKLVGAKFLRDLIA
jgi:cell division septum initiation protein DivIVA